MMTSTNNTIIHSQQVSQNDMSIIPHMFRLDNIADERKTQATFFINNCIFSSEHRVSKTRKLIIAWHRNRWTLWIFFLNIIWVTKCWLLLESSHRDRTYKTSGTTIAIVCLHECHIILYPFILGFTWTWLRSNFTTKALISFFFVNHFRFR